MKRTSSFEPDKTIENINGQDNGIVQEVFGGSKVHPQISEAASGDSMRRTKKIPDLIYKKIIETAHGKKKAMKTSKVGFILSGVFKKIRDITFVCGICEMEYKDEEKTKIGDTCEHFFCDSCLQHYVIYKVGVFEEVVCPDDTCDLVLNPESRFFANLPIDIQKKYTKLHAFYVTSKDPNLKLCPNEKCQDGMLKLTGDGEPLQCSKCNEVFCAKCFFKNHEGECDKNELEFFENNLHYRQCTNCKSVIERSSGCNHMTCRCGYQFCYICGGHWEGYHHICPHNQANQDRQNILNQNRQNNAGIRAPIRRQQHHQTPCCGCECDCQCSCFDNANNCCEGLLIVITLIVCRFPAFLIITTLLFARLILIFALLLAVTILTGIFPYTCEVISNAEAPANIFMIIFYPLTMLLGIGVAFSDFFCPTFAPEGENFCDSVEDVWENLICR